MPELKMADIEQWIKTVPDGEFHYKDVLDGTVDPTAYPKLREYVRRCCDKGICESLGKRDGWYRRIEELLSPVNWKGIDSRQDSNIILPFDLRKYVWIDPNTSIVVAGSKDSGKTGFLMRTVVLNMNTIKTIFLSNMEGGVNQVKRRFEAMGIDMENPAFKTYPVIDNFHDAIKEPNALYVIDYIDVPESGEFYMIAPALAKIQTRLKNNVAIIGLQKKTTSDWAYGGEQTLKKTTLYLAMNPGKIKIVSAKVWATKTLNPKNMQWTFTYDEEGTAFRNITPFYGEQ